MSVLMSSPTRQTEHLLRLPYLNCFPHVGLDAFIMQLCTMHIVACVTSLLHLLHHKNPLALFSLLLKAKFSIWQSCGVNERTCDFFVPTSYCSLLSLCKKSRTKNEDRARFCVINLRSVGFLGRWVYDQVNQTWLEDQKSLSDRETQVAVADYKAMKNLQKCRCIDVY